MSEPGTQTTTPKRTSSWWRFLLGGIALFVVGVALLLLTGNPNLFPTVVLVGNLAVPMAYVSFFYERKHVSALTMPTTAATFLYGGLLGVFAASILEPFFVRGPTVEGLAAVAVIEELVKILGVLLIARRRNHDSALDGLILGAAAGMGFAALESLGYAFTAFLRSSGSLSATVGVTLLRGLLSPLGHGTWTALLVGALFGQSRGGRYRLNLRVLGTYLGVVGLHFLWDLVPGVIAAVLPQGIDVLLGQLLLGGIGLLFLWLAWRRAVRAQDQQVASTPATQPGMPPSEG